MKSWYCLFSVLFISTYLISQSTYQKGIESIRYEPRGYKNIYPFSTYLSSEGIYHLGLYEESRNNVIVSSPTIFKLSSDGELEWMKSYENPDYLSSSVGFRGDGLSDIIEVDENQLVSCIVEGGRARSFNGTSSVFLSFDRAGNQIWDNIIAGRVRSNLVINNRNQLLFSHWLFDSENDEFLLVEMKKNGETVSARQIIAPVLIYKLIQTKDGNTFFIAYNKNPNFNGWTNASLYFSTVERAYIGKIDENYNLIWMKTVSDALPLSVKETVEGDLILSSFSGIEESSYLTKLNSSGEEIWSKLIPLSDGAITDNININSKGEIILLSNTNLLSFTDLAYLSAIDPIGEIQWTRIMPRDWGSYPSSSVINFTKNDEINFHGTIARYAVFHQLDSRGQSQQQPFPSICVASQDVQIEWRDTLIDFIGETTIELDEILSTDHLMDTSAVIEDFVPNGANGEFLTPYFDLPDTTCIINNITPTILPESGFDQYNWIFESSNNPKFNEREPDPVTYAEAGTFLVTLVTDQDNCLDTFSREIVIVDTPDFDLGKDLTLCEEESLELDAFSTNLQTYTWSDGTTAPVLLIDRSGQYNITVTDEYCAVEDSVNVDFISELYPDFRIDLGKDTTICGSEPYQLQVDSKDIDALVWNDGDDRTIKNITESGIYQVTAFIGDCPFEAEVAIDFKDCSSQVFIPNAFSPNGDGLNEELLIGGKNITLVAVQVFDRWGSLIFDEVTRPWDGKINGEVANEGTYIYQVIYVENLTGERELVTGTISLVR